jgi:hypothetical protein
MPVGGFPFTQSNIERVLYIDWANFSAFTAASADIFIDETGFSPNFYIEIPDVTGN